MASCLDENHHGSSSLSRIAWCNSLAILVVLVHAIGQLEMTQEITTHSAEETIAFGRTLASLFAPPKLVLLRGDLGAGKTTLVKGIAAGFEAAKEEDVTSPTFTLVHEYHGPRANLYHIDLYRVDTPRELVTLGLDDLRGDKSVLLIEWGEKFSRLARERDVEISLERINENERKIRIIIN